MYDIAWDTASDTYNTYYAFASIYRVCVCIYRTFVSIFEHYLTLPVVTVDPNLP